MIDTLRLTAEEAKGLLERNPHPSLEQIRHGMSGNLCRCGAYQKIFASVDRAARRMNEEVS